MRKLDGKLLFAAHDLDRFLACPRPFCVVVMRGDPIEVEVCEAARGILLQESSLPNVERV